MNGTKAHNARTCKHCQRYPQHGYLVWAAVIGGALLMEAEGLRRRRFEHTLSASTRYVFKTHTPTGKVAFVSGWAALTMWFLPHVLNGANKLANIVEDLVEEVTP
jgi:hypothetical protein